MSDMTLTKTRFHGGVWEGILTGGGATPPRLILRHQDQDIAALDVTANDAAYLVRAQVPVERLGDGVQTFTIAAENGAEALASFSIVAGEPVEDDLRAEIALLRAELDLLKRAFRNHCAG